MKAGWQTRTIGQTCTITSGGTPSSSNESYWSGEIPWVSAKDLKSDRIFTAALHISEESVKASATKIAPTGSLLVLVRGMGLANGVPIGEVTAPVAFNQDIKAIHPPETVVPRFLLLALRNSLMHRDRQHILSSAAHGTLKIETDALRQLSFPMPALSEQKRIIGILDEAFEGLATAKADAEKNLQNARALFESRLESVFAQRGKGWVKKKLGDITTFKNGLNFSRQSNGQTLRIVGVGDFQDHSVVPIETLQSVTIDGELGVDYSIRRDDILTVRSNGSRDLVGRCMLVPDVGEMTSFSGFIIRLRFDTREISPRFLLHFMRSSATRDRLTRDGGGANISNINQAKLSELPISLPSFKQQADIAGRLDDLHEESQRLESIYQRKVVALDALTKSLLHEAFIGRL